MRLTKRVARIEVAALAAGLARPAGPGRPRLDLGRLTDEELVLYLGLIDEPLAGVLVDLHDQAGGNILAELSAACVDFVCDETGLSREQLAAHPKPSEERIAPMLATVRGQAVACLLGRLEALGLRRAGLARDDLDDPELTPARYRELVEQERERRARELEGSIARPPDDEGDAA